MGSESICEQIAVGISWRKHSLSEVWCHFIKAILRNSENQRKKRVCVRGLKNAKKSLKSPCLFFCSRVCLSQRTVFVWIEIININVFPTLLLLSVTFCYALVVNTRTYYIYIHRH